MPQEINQQEQDLLRALEKGVRRALIYKVGIYPEVVCLESLDGGWVTLHARSVDLASRFEVFPLSVAFGVAKGEPDQEVLTTELSQGCVVSILRKAEWDLPSSSKDMEQMMGDPEGATTQYQGSPSAIPSAALHSEVLDAGVELRALTGRPFCVATSMFPFALYVSDCPFSEQMPDYIYERRRLR